MLLLKSDFIADLLCGCMHASIDQQSKEREKFDLYDACLKVAVKL
jgi:hypothetical protein